MSCFMSRYELIFLLANEEELNNIKDMLKTASGKLLEEKKWGERGLAYPIKKANSANFFEWVLELETEALADFKKKLGFNDKIIRYLLLKQD